MTENYLNLDELISEKRQVKFLGTEFELGYIPCGLSIPILKLHNAQIERELEANKKGSELSQEELLENEIRVVSTFCSFYDPRFDSSFIAKNATDKQLYAMYVQIVSSIVENFGTANQNQKETETKPKKKPTGRN